MAKWPRPSGVFDKNLQLPHEEIVSLIAVPKPIEFIEHNREELMKELRFNQRLEFLLAFLGADLWVTTSYAYQIHSIRTTTRF